MNSSTAEDGLTASPEGLPQPDSEPERRQIYGIDTTVVRYFGAEYYVPDYAAHRPVAKNVLRKRRVSPSLHRFVGRVLKRRPGSIVHAGTFFGDMLPSFSRKTPGVVYAFEPVVENYLLARAVVETNKLENVLLMHSGLGATMGVATLGVARGEQKRHLGGASRILTPESTAHSLTQLTSMLTVDQLGIEDLVLIQLDTEGYELPVLQGAAETIHAQSPVIVVEDNKANCGDFLAGLGYVQAGRLSGDTVYAASAGSDEVTKLISRSRRSRSRGAEPDDDLEP
jgi:FkbM family methyltransferase